MNVPEKVFSGFQVATLARPGTVLASDENGQPLFKAPSVPYTVVENGVVGVTNGQIEWIVPREMLPPLPSDVEVIHGHHRWLTPGLIDCHTHLIYGGNRANEWESRLNGVSYQEIARAGGGILSSVRSTRSASEDDLLASAEKRLDCLLREGVTSVEIKSGYGLDLETELKMLRVAQQIGNRRNVHVEATLLAAHAIPPEFAGRGDAYIDWICRELIPAARGLCTAVDAFCETIAFSVQQVEALFAAAQQAGLKIKVHAEQLSRTGIAVAAAKHGALSVDHVEYLSDDDCAELGKYTTVATLLPGAFYCLRETQKPPIAALRKNKVAMAVATDSNPGSSPVVSLLLMGNMACNLFGLTPEESLAGMTRNAAQALGLQDRLGTLEPGKQADLTVWNVESPAEIFYGLGLNPCTASFRKGVLRDLD
ncbi:MAG: imidazolonepropionase [Pirellulaceae bacterium]